MGATPAVSIGMSSASGSGIDGMVKAASPVTIYTGYNITEKFDCTYEQLQRHEPPRTMCMNGDCESNENGIWECTVERCGPNASSFEEECEQAQCCGMCQQALTPVVHIFSLLGLTGIANKFMNKEKNS